MKHMRVMTCRAPKAAATGIGTYLVLAGQIITILADLFADKEVLVPTDTTEGEAE